MLEKLLRIRWQDKIPDTEVLTRANLPSVHVMLQRAQTRWAGHLCRMPDSRILKQLFYGELTEGNRRVGGRKRRFNDSKVLTEASQHPHRHMGNTCRKEVVLGERNSSRRKRLPRKPG